jgi:choice-of-anchor B domain-containing protein
MDRSISAVAALFFVVIGQIYPQSNLNLQLVGKMQTRGTSQYSNCWGYNAPGGKEYAIVGTANGTQIVDITSDTLKEVAFIPGPSSAWREMKVYQKYAYVVTEGSGAGLQIIDLDSLKLVNTITTTQVPSGHTISQEGKYLYISGGRYKVGGIVVLDLTDPVHPAYVGEYQAQYVHDCFVKNDTIYAAAIYGIGLDIIDATNKSDIKRIKLVNYPFAGTHNTDVSQDGKYVFTTDEINNDPGQNGNIVRVWDKSDIQNVKLVGSYVAKPKTIAHNIHVKGTYAYVAHYTEGVRIIDIANPEIPVEVAYYDTYPGSANSTIGNWGVFPYYSSNKIIATDMNGGLFVFKFPGQNIGIPAARSIVTVVDSLTNLPIEGVTVEQVGTTQTFITNAQGRVQFGSLTDTLTIKLSQSTYSSGYHTRFVTITMPFGTTGNATIKLLRLPTGGLSITVKDSVTSLPIPGVKVQVLNTPEQGFSNVSGEFSVPSLLAGSTYKAYVSKFGYAVDSIEAQVAADQQNAVQISLFPSGKDDFNFDLGWTVGSAGDSGTAGRWQRAVPKPIILIGDTVQPPFGRGGPNDHCFVTGPTNSLADNVEGRTSFISPAFSMTGMANPAILYWVFINSRANPIDDTLYVQISNDNGTQWHTAEVISAKQARWKQYKIIVNAVVTATQQMKIRFIARDGGAPSVFNAAIDDVEFGNDLQLSVKEDHRSIPTDFALFQNYPNPFNPTSLISYQIPTQSDVTLKVFDVIGKEIATLYEGTQSAGVHHVQFTASGISSGVYFYELSTAGSDGMIRYLRKKMLLVK